MIVLCFSPYRQYPSQTNANCVIVYIVLYMHVYLILIMYIMINLLEFVL